MQLSGIKEWDGDKRWKQRTTRMERRAGGRRLTGFSVAGSGREGQGRDWVRNKHGSKPDFPVAQMVKKQAARQKTWVRPLGQEDPLEKGMATHSSVLAWKIP